MKTAVFIDIHNLFCGGMKKYQQRVDYKKLMKALRTHGDAIRVIGYNPYDENALNFNRFLTDLGIQLKLMPNYNINIPLTLDVVRVIDSVEAVIIVSNDLNLLPVLDFIKERGKSCIVYGFRLQMATQQSADKWIELKNEFLKEATNAVPAPATA